MLDIESYVYFSINIQIDKVILTRQRRLLHQDRKVLGMMFAEELNQSHDGIDSSWGSSRETTSQPSMERLEGY